MLNKIFQSITPENIKDIKVAQDAMDIFTEVLNEQSSISVNIADVYKQEKKVIREELLKVYQEDLYRIFTDAQTSRVIQEKIDSVNEIYGGEVIQKDFIGDITKTLNDEYFLTSKEFKQKKGTKLAIEYIYNLIENLDTTVGDKGNFQLTESAPFQFKIEGSLYKEIYEGMVKPVAHPLGWAYIYDQILKVIISDLFNIEYQYNIYNVEVRCLTGYFDIFTPDGDDTNVKEEFLTRINPDTGEEYTEEYYDEYVTVFTNKVPDTLDLEDRNESKYNKVIFEDGTYVEQYFNPIEVNYKDSDDNTIKTYTEHCSLYLKYDYAEKILTLDETKFEKDFEIAHIKENNNGNREDSDYYRISQDFAFQVGGDRTLYELNSEYLDKGDSSTLGNIFEEKTARVAIYYSQEHIYLDTSDMYWLTDNKNVQDDIEFEIHE